MYVFVREYVCVRSYVIWKYVSMSYVICITKCALEESALGNLGREPGNREPGNRFPIMGYCSHTCVAVFRQHSLRGWYFLNSSQVRITEGHSATAHALVPAPVCESPVPVPAPAEHTPHIPAPGPGPSSAVSRANWQQTTSVCACLAASTSPCARMCAVVRGLAVHSASSAGSIDTVKCTANAESTAAIVNTAVQMPLATPSHTICIRKA
mmetsp:Transcript_9755/g.21702  ORF Transcript_9755/g.21702 Transcript_9755/m.21702 type:complete len:210 (+) Transcript_9755:76-705(+)